MSLVDASVYYGFEKKKLLKLEFAEIDFNKSVTKLTPPFTKVKKKIFVCLFVINS